MALQSFSRNKPQQQGNISVCKRPLNTVSYYRRSEYYEYIEERNKIQYASPRVLSNVVEFIGLGGLRTTQIEGFNRLNTAAKLRTCLEINQYRIVPE